MHLQESTLFHFDLDLYPLHHMAYAPAKFEAAMSNGLGEMHLQEIFDLTPRSRSHEALPSTSYDLGTCKV